MAMVFDTEDRFHDHVNVALIAQEEVMHQPDCLFTTSADGIGTHSVKIVVIDWSTPSPHVNRLRRRQIHALEDRIVETWKRITGRCRDALGIERVQESLTWQPSPGCGVVAQDHKIVTVRISLRMK